MSIHIENGLRKVKPYYVRNRINCKERWFDRSVITVLTNEFKLQSKSEHARAIAEGRVKVLRGRNPPGSYCMDELDELSLKNHDVLEYNVHWHEPPIPAKEIRVVTETDDLVVVDKPSGVPVHPSGSYKSNTVTEIMQDKLGYKIYPIHRLDKLTSGLLVLGKNSSIASTMGRKLQDRTVQKRYLARVKGQFPDHEMCTYRLCDFSFTLPTEAFAQRAKSGCRQAETCFKALKYSPSDNCTIVECLPSTGRLHQIRKHLCMLGFPIINDSVYSQPKMRELLLAVHNQEEGECVALFAALQEAYKQGRSRKHTGEVCSECGVNIYADPVDLGINLHAMEYSSSQWSFKCNPPDWI
ncbi:tRNA pseudouridine(31) synthase [Trichomonascus vanleenenianus]|uniref:pseudouridine synthase family protein n=1 Tax=Trichomonascus vanleenenianus TaxID=2268995 RepID=UPI003EC96B3D